MRPTYHLVPADAWTAHDRAVAYAPPSLAAEGFIHCTDGAEAMVATANRHYRDDPRSFLVLTVDLDAIAARPGGSTTPTGSTRTSTGRSRRLRSWPRCPSRGRPTGRSWHSASDVPDGVAVATDLRGRGDLRSGRGAACDRRPGRSTLPGSRELIRGSGDRGRRLPRPQHRAPARRGRQSEDAVDLFEDDVYLRTGVWTAVSAKPFGRVIPTAYEPPPAA